MSFSWICLYRMSRRVQRESVAAPSAQEVLEEQSRETERVDEEPNEEIIEDEEPNEEIIEDAEPSYDDDAANADHKAQETEKKDKRDINELIDDLLYEYFTEMNSYREYVPPFLADFIRPCKW